MQLLAGTAAARLLPSGPGLHGTIRGGFGAGGARRPAEPDGADAAGLGVSRRLPDGRRGRAGLDTTRKGPRPAEACGGGGGEDGGGAIREEVARAEGLVGLEEEALGKVLEDDGPGVKSEGRACEGLVRWMRRGGGGPWGRGLPGAAGGDPVRCDGGGVPWDRGGGGLSRRIPRTGPWGVCRMPCGRGWPGRRARSAGREEAAGSRLPSTTTPGGGYPPPGGVAGGGGNPPTKILDPHRDQEGCVWNNRTRRRFGLT